MGRRKSGSVRLSICAMTLLASGVLLTGQAQAGYNEDVEPIMKSKCISCHATQEPKLNNYTEVSGKIVDIVTAISIAENGPEKTKLMPKGGPKLDQASIDKIKTWQSAGTPEKNSSTGNPGNQPATPPATGSTDPGTTDIGATDPSSTDTPAGPGTTPGTDVPGPGTESGKPTPLILDLDGKGSFAFTKKTVAFDIVGNGFKQSLSWPLATSAFLALDLNGNGSIDNGKEFFGDSTALLNSKSRNAANGFEALAQYDSNRDGFITSSDPIFSRLLVWHDQNENGLTDTKELSALTSYGITSLSLSFVAHVQTMTGGIEIPLLVSYYLTTDTKGVSTNKVLADIFLTYQAK